MFTEDELTKRKKEAEIANIIMKICNSIAYGEKPENALKKIGVSIYDENGNALALEEIYENIAKKWDSWVKTQKEKK